MPKKIPEDQAFLEFAKILGIDFKNPRLKEQVKNKSLDDLTRALNKYGSKNE